MRPKAVSYWGNLFLYKGFISSGWRENNKEVGVTNTEKRGGVNLWGCIKWRRTICCAYYQCCSDISDKEYSSQKTFVYLPRMTRRSTWSNRDVYQYDKQNRKNRACTKIAVASLDAFTRTPPTHCTLVIQHVFQPECCTCGHSVQFNNFVHTVAILTCPCDRTTATYLAKLRTSNVRQW